MRRCHKANNLLTCHVSICNTFLLSTQYTNHNVVDMSKSSLLSVNHVKLQMVLPVIIWITHCQLICVGSVSKNKACRLNGFDEHLLAAVHM